MGLEAATYVEDLVVANPASGDFKSEGDDHLRLVKTVLKNTFPGLAGAFGRTQSKGAGYTVVANDNTTQIVATAALTLSLTAAATLGNKHSFSVDASGGDVTLDPDGAELVNGVSTFVVPIGFIGLVWCNGTGFTCALTKKASESVQTISGDITLTSANLAGQKEVTAAADITLPAASTALIGTKTLIHTSTTSRVRIVPNGSNTIEGLNQNYRVPSWSTIELMCISASAFILLRAPQHFVGQLIPSAVAQTLPGFLPADFAAVSRTTYGGLFDLLSTTHGPGDGSTTFNVPDTRGRALIGAGTGSTTEAVDAAAVNTTNDTFDVVSNVDKWTTGMKVQVTTTGTLPGGISAVTDYWIIRGSATTIKFASSLSAAQNNSPLNISTQGTGIHTVTHALSARAVGERGGEESHAMSSVEMLSHNHTQNPHVHQETNIDGNDNVDPAFEVNGVGTAISIFGTNTNGSVTANPLNTVATTATNNANGANNAMNNESPYGVAQYYVKT